jgi:seryl-tRNA synthetase
MTTENTTTDTTATETAPLTPIQIAEEFVKENSSATIVEEFVNHYNAIENYKIQVARLENERNAHRTRWATMSDSIEEFLKSHIGENDDASVDELKELAENLGIELTKQIKVTFTIEVEVDMEVELDFDEENIDESDFSIDITYDGQNDADIEWNVNDFECEEN